MSFVHIIDVFDPIGLPPNLSNQEAADCQRSKHLSAPSSKLLELMKLIHTEPLSLGVNVAAGDSGQSIEWLDGDSPNVRGAGATCALWTLFIPMEDDVDDLQDTVMQLNDWADDLGLRIYDQLYEDSMG